MYNEDQYVIMLGGLYIEMTALKMLDNLVLSTKLTMQVSHRKEIRKLTFRALAFVGANRSDGGITLETSALSWK